MNRPVQVKQTDSENRGGKFTEPAQAPRAVLLSIYLSLFSPHLILQRNDIKWKKYFNGNRKEFSRPILEIKAKSQSLRGFFFFS